MTGKHRFSELYHKTRLLGELNGLLGLDLDEHEHEPGDFDVFIRKVSRQIIKAVEEESYSFPKEATLALIELFSGRRYANCVLEQALTSGLEDSVSLVISDLAEILFIEREQRTEYVTNQETFPPYKIGKLLLEYAVKSRCVDEIVGMMTKGYCAETCDKLPIGCCHILGYDLGLVPEVMLRAQEIEARRCGWTPSPTEDKCKFHTASGCQIALFKSPACVGYLCPPLEKMLKEKYPTDKLGAFLDALVVFRNCDIDRSKVFDAMDAVIEKGSALDCMSR
ncbi:MAG: hypothetical protein GY847_36935 [Proteobacteria bacterium]|nr:hypothetical protein [Pseudomonadota bacterium]